MNLKSAFVFILLFGIQFLISCIPSICDCTPGLTIAIEFDGVSLKALDTSGFKNGEVVDDTVHRNSFGLILENQYSETTISELNYSPKFGSGFSAAMACSCIENTYTYPDPIIQVDLFIIDDQSGERKSGNNDFSVYSYYNEGNTTLSETNWNEIFHPEWYPYIEVPMELINGEVVASSSIFEIVLTLKSGKTLTGQTQVINFFD